MVRGEPEPATWGKPARVEIAENYLVAEFGTVTYPLNDAIEKARALRALMRDETDEEARRFTAAWGLLCRGWGDVAPYQ